MDVFVLSGLVRELQSWIGARMGKVYQLASGELLLQLHKAGEGKKLLLISAESSAPGLVPLVDKPLTPDKPTDFAMVLRKHLSGAFLHEIAQPMFDRLVELTFRRNGDELTRRLVCEFFGRHANVILCQNDGHIVDVLHPVRPEESDKRCLTRNEQYRLPPEPETGVRLEDLDLETLRGWKGEDGTISKNTLRGYVYGLSPNLVHELIDGTEATPERVMSRIDAWRQRVAESRLDPWIYRRGRRPPFIAAFELDTMEPVESYESFSEAAREIVSERLSQARLTERRQKLLGAVGTRIRQLERRVEKVEGDLERMNDLQEMEQEGELLKANLHVLDKGMTEVTVTDYYDEDQPQRTIQLDPARTPVENMERRFAKARRGRRGRKRARARLTESRQELQEWRELEAEIEESWTEQQLDQLWRRAREQGLSLQRVAAKTAFGTSAGDRSDRSSSPWHSFERPNGVVILCGKSAKGNDELLRHAHREDLWFHVRGWPGAHVILRVGGERIEPDDDDILDAARLAGIHSRAHGEGAVDVMYTRVKNVRRVTGGAPGQVTVRHEKTVTVAARNERLQLNVDKEDVS